MLVLTSLLTTSGLRRVPGGHLVPGECVVALPNHGLFNVNATLPSCKGARGSNLSMPEIQIYAADVHLDSKDPLTSFTADWTVPPLPSSHSAFSRQVVYFWPGFKAMEPEMGYPVLQPVLQYGEHGPEWALQSWFVDAKDPRFPVVTAPAISVKPGHRITRWRATAQPHSAR